MGSDQNKCSYLWGHAEWLTLDAVINYWCEGEPNKSPCNEAKRQLIIEGCENNEVKHRASNGEAPFKRDAYELARRDVLLINRESFEEWARKFYGTDTHLPPRGYSKREETLLKIIGGLLVANYQGKAAYMHGDRLNKSEIAKHIRKNLKQTTGLGETTITEKITPALEAIQENLRQW